MSQDDYYYDDNGYDDENEDHEIYEDPYIIEENKNNEHKIGNLLSYNQFQYRKKKNDHFNFNIAFGSSH